MIKKFEEYNELNESVVINSLILASMAYMAFKLFITNHANNLACAIRELEDFLEGAESFNSKYRNFVILNYMARKFVSVYTTDEKGNNYGLKLDCEEAQMAVLEAVLKTEGGFENLKETIIKTLEKEENKEAFENQHSFMFWLKTLTQDECEYLLKHFYKERDENGYNDGSLKYAFKIFKRGWDKGYE